MNLIQWESKRLEIGIYIQMFDSSPIYLSGRSLTFEDSNPPVLARFHHCLLVVVLLCFFQTGFMV